MAQAPAQQQRQLSAQERAMNFAAATRQYIQQLPSQTVNAENTTVEFQLPKSRLLSKVILQVQAVATLSSSAGTIARDAFTPYKVLNKVSLDLNNGFAPFNVSGRDLFLYSSDRVNPDVLLNNTSSRAMTYVGNTASAGGTDNAVNFTVELPVTLNDREPTGLIVLQNPETYVTVKVDVGALQDAYALNATNSDVVAFKSMVITAAAETFSIPPIPQAIPDTSVLKLVGAKRDIFSSGGQNIMKLETGTVYRKLMMYFEDNSGNPLADADFTGNLELVFNQADAPYAIKPSFLAAKNHSDFGYPLPAGLYILDLSNQGIPNLGGSRDYIDTEKLTEFWLRFTPNKDGKVTVVSEKLTRLQG